MVNYSDEVPVDEIDSASDHGDSGGSGAPQNTISAARAQTSEEYFAKSKDAIPINPGLHALEARADFEDVTHHKPLEKRDVYYTKTNSRTRVKGKLNVLSHVITAV